MQALILAVCCTVTIHVHTASGAPVSGAHLSLHGPHTYATTSDDGGFATVQADPGSYQLDAALRGYESIEADLFVHDSSAVDVTLQALDAPTLRTISRVTVDGRLAPIHGEIPSVIVTREAMDELNENRVVEALTALPGATFTRPDGGAASAIDVVSLRGPDPSESLITLDGQLLNDGNTGDIDLSRFPTAAFSGIDVTEGLGPEDSNGSNTFGGAINFISLEPTQAPHFSLQTSGGSFGQSETWINATGTHDRLGYALALDDQHEQGYVNQVESVNGTPTFLGSAVASRLGLMNLAWNFGQNSNISARVFDLGDNRDQSSAVNGENPDGTFSGPGPQTFAQSIRAYQLRGETPLGAGELIASASESDNGVTVDGGSLTPYDITHVDRRYDGEAHWQRTFANSEFAFGGYTRYESLAFPGAGIPQLGQTINVGYARGGFDPTDKLHLDGGIFESHYSTFGSNLDGRAGAVLTLDRSTQLRASIGTGFRAPLLAERYEFPLSQLQQDANGVFIGQGSTNEHPEHATEYELGISHEFQSATLDVSVYQTNLRDPIEIYYPLALATSGACVAQTPLAPVPGCVSYNSNVGNAVYQGAEARFVQSFVPQHLFLTAMYGLNVAYPKDLTSDFSNPTSGGNLVDDEQFLGIAQQQGSLELAYRKDPWHAAVQATFRGNNNELNQGPFTIIDAAVGIKVNAISDVTLSGTNLFSDDAGRFTRLGAGVQYRGAGGTALSTDALYLEPLSIRFAYTIHM
jgi:outer membrane cobalamin receptor